MKITMMVFMLLLATGCGALRINPKSCRTDAVWGSNPLSSREVIRENLEDKSTINIKSKESFFVFYDRDIRLRDILKKHGVRCEEVKKLRVVITTSWFFKREVNILVVKK